MRCRRLLLVAAAAIPMSAVAEPVRLAIDAFGGSAEVEVRGLSRKAARAAAEAALTEVFELGRLTATVSTAPGGIGALNAAAGQGPQPVDQRIATLLARALQFCAWSAGAHGPLGGELYGFLSRHPAFPEDVDPAQLAGVLAGTDCRLLQLADGDEPETVTASLPAGSRLDTRGLARGFAVDSAVEVLRGHGVEHAWVQVGEVVRTLGDGPRGDGWGIDVPGLDGTEVEIGGVVLKDKALASAIRDGGGAVREVGLYFDQRSGRPAEGVVGIVAVADSATDAQALATTLMITGILDGQRRLGALEPRPSIYWLLGQGESRPLESSFNWSALPRLKRR